MKLNSKIFITVLTLAPLVLTSCQETSVSTGTSQGGGLHVISLPTIDPGVKGSPSENSQSSVDTPSDARNALIESTYQRQSKDKIKIGSSANSFKSQFDVTFSNGTDGSSDQNDVGNGSTNVTGKANRSKGITDTQFINLQKDINQIQGSTLNSGFFDITDVLVTETKKNTTSASEPQKKKDFHDTISRNSYVDSGYAYLDLTGIVSVIKNYTSVVFPMQKIKTSISSYSSSIEKETREEISEKLSETENKLSKDITYSGQGSEYSLNYTFDRTDLDRFNLTTIFDSRNRKINLKYTNSEFRSLSLSGSRKRNYSKKARKLIIDSMPESDEKTKLKKSFEAIPLEKATISLTNRNFNYTFAYDSVSPVVLKDVEKARYTEIKTTGTGN
ncbi:MAG: hypothetical protein SO286_02640 [Candidatus Enterosoma sp.]|nr:hypothetical protein [Candidatus Enterosoma sp.]